MNERWRPRNETELDLARERAAAQSLSEAWSCDVVKLSEGLYHIDWAFYVGTNVVALGEYKFREKRYDTLMISSAKIFHGMQLARFMGKPFLLVIEWASEGIHWVDLTKFEPTVAMGRNNRGQNGDLEPCVFICGSMFVPLRKRCA